LTSRTLLSPLLAAAITLLVLAAVREPYSGTELAVFVALWTSCMAAVRTTVWRITPPARATSPAPGGAAILTVTPKAVASERTIVRQSRSTATTSTGCSSSVSLPPAA
jgi:hypothetical protein